MDSRTGRTVWETRRDETDEERLAARLAERPAERRARIATRRVDPDQVAALRRLWAA